MSRFSYSKDVSKDNLNLACFSFGSAKHLLALSDGTLPSVSKKEFNNRLQHFINVLEISLLNSHLSDFDSPSWREARCYSERVLHDIETDYKDWLTLDRSIDPTCWTMARQSRETSDYSSPDLSENYIAETEIKKCTSWDLFRKEGCQYEYLNPGRKCKFVHSCVICEANGVPDMPHKAWQCPDNQSDSEASFTEYE